MALYVWSLVLLSLAIASVENAAVPKPNTKIDLQYLFSLNDNELRETANQVVDRVLEDVNREILSKGKDPIELPDVINEFSYRVGFITYSGELSYKNGWLQGLSTLKRYKNAVLTKEGDDVIVNTSLQYEILVFDYQYTAKFMKLGPKGNLDGRIARSTLTIKLRVRPDGTASLEKYKFNKLGSLSLKWSGNGLTDWLANIFTVVTKPFLKPILKGRVSGYIEDTLIELIEEHNEGLAY